MEYSYFLQVALALIRKLGEHLIDTLPLGDATRLLLRIGLSITVAVTAALWDWQQVRPYGMPSPPLWRSLRLRLTEQVAILIVSLLLHGP